MKIQIGGHQTFYPRQGWLAKGIEIERSPFAYEKVTDVYGVDNCRIQTCLNLTIIETYFS